MNESSITAKLTAYLREHLPGSVVFKHCDVTAGLPDVSVTWGGITVWLEIKFANPRFKGTGLQHHTMTNLARVGHADYVIFGIGKDGEKFTVICAPDSLSAWRSVHHRAGFDFEAVADLVRAYANQR